ncbi:MAG: hypothetical protein LBS68_02245, partial [Puniceicoccales bacterium]|nr:hypothetical protein [Puniceicoccales bacterium]
MDASYNRPVEFSICRRQPDVGGPHHAAPPPQRADSGERMLFSVEVAKARLMYFLGEYPEAEGLIKEEVRRLTNEGVDIPHIEVAVGDMLDGLKSEILAQREERIRLIRDPNTRLSVVPRAGYERELWDARAVTEAAMADVATSRESAAAARTVTEAGVAEVEAARLRAEAARRVTEAGVAEVEA